MYHRLTLWMALFVFTAMGVLRAQTPSTSAAPAAMPQGQIVAKQVQGKVTMRLNGVDADLHNGDAVSQSATIITEKESSVVLVFSNGATTQLGSETTLSIEEFTQDPIPQQVNLATLTEEPTTSHTKLHLTKGEVVGKVVHLKHNQGSTFTVQTPVGAAGIRGTTFRIVFRPTGSGQAFFQLSTLEGNVHLLTGGTTVSGTVSGVPVTSGTEVIVTVEVNVNRQTGEATVTSTPTVSSTQPISAQTQAAIAQVAVTLAETAATTTFAPTSGGQSSGGATSDSSGSSTGTGSGTGSASGTPTSSGSTTPTQSTSTPSTTPQPPPPSSPPATPPSQHTTPLAGSGGG